MATIKWSVASIQTLLSTELNSLATGNLSALGTEYDNTSGLYLFADFQLDVTFGSSPTANAPVVLYIVPKTDGTNYNFGSSSNAWDGFVRGGWSLMATTSQQLLTIQGVPIPPLKFKIQVKNQSGQSFPGSGSTVKMVPYYYQSV